MLRLDWQAFPLIIMLLAGCGKQQSRQSETAKSLEPVYLAQGVMAGEVTEDSVILQTRLTASPGMVDGDVPGARGFVRFHITTTSEDMFWEYDTEWIEAKPEDDFIVKAEVTGLKPGTRYLFDALPSTDGVHTFNGAWGEFTTLGGKDTEGEVSFVVVTGMNYGKFHYGRLGVPVRRLTSPTLGDWYVHSGEWRVEENGSISGSSQASNAYLVRTQGDSGGEIVLRGKILRGNEFTVWFSGSPARTEKDGYSLAIGDYGARLQRKGREVARTNKVEVKAGEAFDLRIERRGGAIMGFLAHGEEAFIEFNDPEPLAGENHCTEGLYVWDGAIRFESFRSSGPAAPLVFESAFYRDSYQGGDKHFGFPAAESILKMKPDFFVGTGDNVYYDSPRHAAAKTPAELRRKWHEQFAQPRLIKLFARVPAYWEKDDHDHRFNDCDNEGDREPPPELGIRMFIEQAPVIDPDDPDPRTYRTHRINKHLQIWLVEGRDYRSPNSMEDGPGKTLWGEEQLAWLKMTLMESDATFKLLISPTPLIGPDRANKRDNHCNIGGFRHERDEFFDWLLENGFLEKNFYIICGDRHWQYHAVHPHGIEEFSCGALVDANTARPIRAGDPKSTDPQGLIKQPYLQEEQSGGFLRVILSMGRHGRSAPTLGFNFYDENGEPLYSTAKSAE